jgi:hypothetical protein
LNRQFSNTGRQHLSLSDGLDEGVAEPRWSHQAELDLVQASDEADRKEPYYQTASSMQAAQFRRRDNRKLQALWWA